MTSSRHEVPIPNPDWVIVGAPLPDDSGVALLASRHLTSATLRKLATDQIPLEAMTAGWMRTGVFLSLHVGIDDYVIATGADYGEAFAVLFGQWGPRGRPALPSSVVDDAAPSA